LQDKLNFHRWNISLDWGMLKGERKDTQRGLIYLFVYGRDCEKNWHKRMEELKGGPLLCTIE
jgi:hypothetical protein